MLQVFPCGCEFSNLHFPDTMKSCRHKRGRNLILDWFRIGGNDLIGRHIAHNGNSFQNRQMSSTMTVGGSSRTSNNTAS